MRFRKIVFDNYRCFINGSIEFYEEENRNINLLLGPIGGGKTETLFAFWWALYDFDFSTLTAKENTPFALNAALYRQLERAEKGEQKSCSVIVEFENNNVIYRVTKRCEYRKTEKGIKEDEYQEFSTYNEIGELSLPERNKDEINKQLSRIVPKQILYGIIFDGERMQKLNTPDEKAKNAIRGVINDITNVELIEKCSIYLRSVKTALNKELKQYLKKSGNENKSKLIEEIELSEANLQANRKNIESFDNELESIEMELIVLSNKMENNKLIKDKQDKRKAEQEKINNAEKRLEEYYKNFNAVLKDGYLLISEKLLNDVDLTIQKYDVPKELTVAAVESILTRTKCICGRHLDEESIKTLNELILSLPPDNMNSTLSEIIRQTREKICDVDKHADQIHKLIIKCESEIKSSKDLIASLSAEISSLGNTDEEAEEAKRMENEYQERIIRQGIIKECYPKLEKEIKQLESSLKEMRQKRDAKVAYDNASQKINKQIELIDKCNMALDKIREVNKNTALDDINERLNKAYESLSEDYKDGRRIRIIQYENSKRYQIIVYLENDVLKLIEEWKTNGEYKELIDNNYNDDQVFERAIVSCPSSNSTGQSKVNTLSFIKAILDYSNKTKSSDGIQITKNYPLLIDAPFGDISGESLEKSSTELHTFANQIILMLDKTRYGELKSILDKNVSKKYEFIKESNQSYSTIKPIEEVL